MDNCKQTNRHQRKGYKNHCKQVVFQWSELNLTLEMRLNKGAVNTGICVADCPTILLGNKLQMNLKSVTCLAVIKSRSIFVCL